MQFQGRRGSLSAEVVVAEGDREVTSGRAQSARSEIDVGPSAYDALSVADSKIKHCRALRPHWVMSKSS